MLPRPDSRRRRRLLPQMETVLSWTRVGAVNSMAFSLARQKMANWTIKLTRHGRCPNYQEGINRAPMATAILEYFRGPDDVPCPLTRGDGARLSHIRTTDEEDGEANKGSDKEVQ